MSHSTLNFPKNREIIAHRRIHPKLWKFEIDKTHVKYDPMPRDLAALFSKFYV